MSIHQITASRALASDSIVLAIGGGLLNYAGQALHVKTIKTTKPCGCNFVS